MTTTDLSPRDRRLILRMLWAFYGLALAVAVACFYLFAHRLSPGDLAAAFAACLGAWCVAGPLEELRHEVTT